MQQIILEIRFDAPTQIRFHRHRSLQRCKGFHRGVTLICLEYTGMDSILLEKIYRHHRALRGLIDAYRLRPQSFQLWGIYNAVLATHNPHFTREEILYMAAVKAHADKHLRDTEEQERQTRSLRYDSRRSYGTVRVLNQSGQQAQYSA